MTETRRRTLTLEDIGTEWIERVRPGHRVRIEYVDQSPIPKRADITIKHLTAHNKRMQTSDTLLPMQNFLSRYEQVDPLPPVERDYLTEEVILKLVYAGFQRSNTTLDAVLSDIPVKQVHQLSQALHTVQGGLERAWKRSLREYAAAQRESRRE